VPFIQKGFFQNKWREITEMAPTDPGSPGKHDDDGGSDD